MIESLIRKYNENQELLPEIIAIIDKTDVDDLIEMYLGYSSSIYFIKYPYIAKILNIMGNQIIKKLDSISLLKVIELYSDIYLKTLETTERLERHRNFVKARLYDEEKMEKFNGLISEESKNIQERYISSVKNPQKDLQCIEESFNFIDKLNTEMFNYLDNRLHTLLSNERDEVLAYLNYKIEENTREINKREEILQDDEKISIISKYGGTGISKFQIRLNLDPTELKIKNEDIYKSLRAIVLDNTNKK